MNYCGIDLAGVSSYLYVTDEKGKKLAAGEVATDKVAFACRLKRFVRGGLSIAIEAGNQTAWVYEALIEMGAKVTVVNPAKAKLIAESRRKTDKIDAKILCELLRLDGLPCPVHVPGRETRASRFAGGPAAARFRTDQAMQCGSWDASPGRDSAAGPGAIELRRLAAHSGQRF